MLNEFHDSQMAVWPLAKKNFDDLKNIETKSFNFDNYTIKVQFNPARIKSSGANTNREAIAARKCFLCSANRPKEQLVAEAPNGLPFEILVNPYPIFEQHLTIVNKQHVWQNILPNIGAMLQMATYLPDYTIFYNGARCGASAPDHMHFQAAPKGALPLIHDYNLAIKKGLVDTFSGTECTTFSYALGRLVYCIDTVSEDVLSSSLKHIFATINSSCEEEPMVNILCQFENGHCYTYVIPRRAQRPMQYGTGPDKLLVSPASVEVAGIFIVPIEEHFKRITADDVQDILNQCCFTKP